MKLRMITASGVTVEVPVSITGRYRANDQGTVTEVEIFLPIDFVSTPGAAYVGRRVLLWVGLSDVHETDGTPITIERVREQLQQTKAVIETWFKGPALKGLS